MSDDKLTFEIWNDILTDLIKQSVSGGILAVLLLLAPVGCDSATKNNHPALAVLRQNIRAAENENLDAYMDTTHPESPKTVLNRMIMKHILIPTI